MNVIYDVQQILYRPFLLICIHTVYFRKNRTHKFPHTQLYPLSCLLSGVTHLSQEVHDEGYECRSFVICKCHSQLFIFKFIIQLNQWNLQIATPKQNYVSGNMYRSDGHRQNQRPKPLSNKLRFYNSGTRIYEKENVIEVNLNWMRSTPSHKATPLLMWIFLFHRKP